MKKSLPIVMLVVVNLIIGLLVLPDYGESTDEVSQHSYAERTIQGVQSLFQTGAWPAYFDREQPKQGSHGPAFIMLVVLLRNLFLPSGTPVQKLLFSHFLYFSMFQVGIVSLYFLARRWLSDAAAFGTALLFNTQPLFVGHAFMNPKDVVFMSLFIASTTLGLWMIDRNEQVYMPTGRPVVDGLRAFFRQFLRPDVWLAGLVLGFSSASRIAAPLVGILVLVHLALSRKWTALPRFFAYGLIAFGFMIAFWPYLWPNPIGRLIESLLNSAYFPDVHFTLFKGARVSSEQLPRSYVPLLLVVQLTETALLLMLIGVVSLFKKVRRDLLAVLLVWFVLPASAIILLKVSLYDNLRQVFFIFPPLFLLAGLGLDRLFALIRRPVLRFSMLLLLLFPGLYADVVLHPYQYVYYNQLAGGVRGAFRHFALDYWRLAFKEAQAYVNESAPPNANIFVGDSKASAQTFARPDLIFNAFGVRKRNWDNYDYMIVSTAENADETYSELPTVFFVERDGVPLVIVKKVH